MSCPDELKELRACKVCSLIQTKSQFHTRGCINCHFLELQKEKVRVREITSSTFNGMIALTEPSASWVARWQRLDGPPKCQPGCYAISVTGEVPDWVIQKLEDMGRHYVPRDRSTS